MTREEANIQDAIHCVKVDLEEEVCEECRLYGLCHTICKDADRIKLEALEKQIPKKVIFEDDGEELLCPNCGFDFMGAFNEPDHNPYYCFECGQALDWTEEGE